MKLVESSDTLALRRLVLALTERVEALELLLTGIGRVFRPEDDLGPPAPDEATVDTISFTPPPEEDERDEDEIREERKEYERLGFVDSKDESF